jgi:hypothetical protein
VGRKTLFGEAGARSAPAEPITIRHLVRADKKLADFAEGEIGPISVIRAQFARYHRVFAPSQACEKPTCQNHPTSHSHRRSRPLIKKSGKTHDEMFFSP